jgi:hypothetical protein
MPKEMCLEGRRTATMSMNVSPTMHHTPFGYPSLGGFIDEPTAEVLTAYRSEYAHRLGYELGAQGEWIAEAPAAHPANR